ncbi:MAG: Glu-tRNA(Gln) amidotransferase subunit GatE, partial [Candidatus Bathyarchaeia archaeon]
MTLDYRKLGLKVGLEIHQQLKTDTKLFCSCRASLSSKPPEFTFYRRLRPTQSELGVVDPAAAFEFQRGRGYVYEADMDTSCLVEMDEEPPHRLNEEAVDIGLMVAMMLNSRPVDEIHVMRKIVIDGSNTTGFQRTCIVSLGGEIVVEGKRIGIQSVSLEEDAARKVGEEGSITRYRIDRLCIPLVEIATAPEINDPEEAEKVALALGRVLRATGKVRRGLGTIRQDLNISISGGALTEIKGIQELELVKPIVEAEVRRQVGLLGIRDELMKRAATKEDLSVQGIDVSELFKDTGCKVLRSMLEKGHCITALKLPKFAGLLGREIAPGIRFGTELSDYARFWGKSEGILHTDELPGYGITEDEVVKLRNAVGAEPCDAVVVIAQSRENISYSIRAILDRAALAIEGDPSET